MACAIFFPCADVEQEGASVGVIAPLLERLVVDVRNPGPFQQPLGMVLRLPQMFRGRLRQDGVFSMCQRMPVEQPCHGAVLERDDRIGHAGVDEGLRADDAAGAARAIDDNRCRGVGRQFADAVG